MLAFAEPPASEAVRTDNSVTRLVASQDAIVPGQEFWVALHMDLEPEWHTYWLNPGDSGLPVTMEVTAPDGFSSGELQFPAPEIIDTAGIINYGFGEEIYFPAKITIPQHIDTNTSEITISAKANWLVCKDICIPESGTYSITVPISPSVDQVATNTELENAINALPVNYSTKGQYKRTGDTVDLTLDGSDLKAGLALEGFYPLTDGIIINGAPLRATYKDSHIFLSYPAGSVSDNRELKGLLVFKKNDNKESYWVSFISESSAGVTGSEAPQRASTEAETSSPFSSSTAPPTEDVSLSLGAALLLALFGGLILNIMPCVLPVLSLKILALTKKSGASRKQLRLHGLAYTAGVLLSFMAIAGLLITLKLAGSHIGWGFQLQSPEFIIALSIIMLLVSLNLLGVFELPILFGGTGHALTGKDSPVGSFFTGVLATLVATPCTAPFMAPAIGFALTQPPLSALLIFEMLGLGLALPFLLITLFPALSARLPKPGAWMQGFKEFLAFPMLATLAWLLWVLALQAGSEALLYGLFILLLIGFVVWVKTRTTAKSRTLWMVIALLGALWLLATLPNSPTRTEEAEEVPFSLKQIETLRAAGSPVFVNATAAWCLTCKLNEISTLSSSTVKEYFQEQGVTYMVADWTNRDKAISDYLTSFERQGVPIYVYYPSNGGAPRLLPQVLTPSLVLEEIKKAESGK